MKTKRLTPEELDRLEASLSRARDGVATPIDNARLRGFAARHPQPPAASATPTPPRPAAATPTATPTPPTKPAAPAAPTLSTSTLREMASAVFGNQLELAGDESDRLTILRACWQNRLTVPGITSAALDEMCAGSWRLPDSRFTGIVRSLSAAAQERVNAFFRGE